MQICSKIMRMISTERFHYFENILEQQTIALALKHNADMVIMDERIGRRVAEYFGLHVTGTLGILAKAKALGLIASFYETAMNMREEGIYFNAALISRLAQHLGENVP